MKARYLKLNIALLTLIALAPFTYTPKTNTGLISTTILVGTSLLGARFVSDYNSYHAKSMIKDVEKMTPENIYINRFENNIISAEEAPEFTKELAQNRAKIETLKKMVSNRAGYAYQPKVAKFIQRAEAAINAYEEHQEKFNKVEEIARNVVKHSDQQQEAL